MHSVPPLRSGALGLLLAVAVIGCKQEEAPVPDPGPTGDRTLEQLRKEVDREQAEKNDPNQRLAELATGAGPEDALEGERPLPPDAKAQVGPFAVAVTKLEASHRAAGSGKLSLTSEDWFLRVTVEATNTDRKAQNADLSFVELAGAASEPLALARDAQRVAGTRELSFELAPGEKKEAVLYFEVPREAFGKGLALRMAPAVAGNPELLIPLEAK
jgi:hypothetical protein